jgi:hypothetical protein
MPEGYAENGFTVRITWIAQSGTDPNAVVWGAAVDRHNDGTDITSDAFDTEQTVVSTAAAVVGQTQYADITFAVADTDGILQGEQFNLKIRRIGTDSSDDMGGDAQITSILISQTYTIPDGADGTAIHDNVAAEISGIGTEETDPQLDDLLLIEDQSAGTAYSKAKLQLIYLPTVTRIAVVASLDAKTETNTLLYTVPSGKTFWVEDVLVYVTAYSSITTQPSCSVGRNATNYDDIFTDRELTGLDAVNEGYSFASPGNRVSASNEGIYLKWNTNAAGAGTMTVTAVLTGYFIQ